MFIMALKFKQLGELNCYDKKSATFSVRSETQSLNIKIQIFLYFIG